MSQIPIAQRFRDAIRNAALSAPPKESNPTSGARARVFIEETEPELSRAFLLDYVERAMRAAEREVVRAAVDTAPDPQMKFVAPGFSELFRSPRQRLAVGPGRSARRVPLEDMTIGQIRKSAEVFAKRAKNAPTLAQRRADYLRKIAEEMSPYADAHYRLTYGHYLQLRADGIIAPQRQKAAH